MKFATQFVKMAAIGLALIAMNTAPQSARAQAMALTPTEWMVWEMQQVPIDQFWYNESVHNLHWELRRGVPCDPIDGHPRALLLNICDEIGKPPIYGSDGFKDDPHYAVSMIDGPFLWAMLDELVLLAEDTDGDGWVDSEDAYPDDPDCWIFAIPGDHWPAGQNC